MLSCSGTNRIAVDTLKAPFIVRIFINRAYGAERRFGALSALLDTAAYPLSLVEPRFLY